MGSGWSASTPRPLYSRWKNSRYMWNDRLFDSQSRSGRFGKDITLLDLLGIVPRFIGRPALCQVTVPAELSRISCIVKWISDIFHFNRSRLPLLVTVGSYTWRRTHWTHLTTSSCVVVVVVVESYKYWKRTHANSSASHHFVHSMYHVNSKNWHWKLKWI